MGMMERKRKISEHSGIRGYVTVHATHDDGRVYQIPQANLVMTAGFTRIAALIAETSTGFPDYIAIGTGTTAAAITQTALVTEVDRNQVASKTASSGVATFKAFFGKNEANGYTISELGLFDLPSGGTMFCRSVLSSTVAKTNTISLTITWTLTFSDGS